MNDRPGYRFQLPLIAVAVAVPLAACCGLALAREKPPARAATAKEEFKNIKVLKDVPAEQMIPVMREWSASLGVRCEHCHVREGAPTPGNHAGFEKDTKPEKATARKMVRLVRDINEHQKALGGKATCFMCHHGKAKPDTRMEIPDVPGRTGPGAR